jgi:DNA-binding response OmpR family regulator
VEHLLARRGRGAASSCASGDHPAPCGRELHFPGMSAHILVVDDEPDISALVAFHLARESYRVRTAADGSEAMRAVELEQPDLIVLDLMLPGMSGLEVLEELRRRPELQEVPVILLTARRRIRAREVR